MSNRLSIMNTILVCLEGTSELVESAQQEAGRTRDLSCVATKVDEAVMWLQRGMEAEPNDSAEADEGVPS